MDPGLSQKVPKDRTFLINIIIIVTMIGLQSKVWVLWGAIRAGLQSGDLAILSETHQG